MAALGNHEFYPVNVQKMSEQDPTLEELADIFTPYMDEDALETFRRYGYFATLGPAGSKFEKTRFISINSEQCNDMNWYLWAELNDPNNEIAWLEH